MNSVRAPHPANGTLKPSVGVCVFVLLCPHALMILQYALKCLSLSSCTHGPPTQVLSLILPDWTSLWAWADRDWQLWLCCELCCTCRGGTDSAAAIFTTNVSCLQPCHVLRCTVKAFSRNISNIVFVQLVYDLTRYFVAVLVLISVHTPSPLFILYLYMAEYIYIYSSLNINSMSPVDIYRYLYTFRSEFQASEMWAAPAKLCPGCKGGKKSVTSIYIYIYIYIWEATSATSRADWWKMTSGFHCWHTRQQYLPASVPKRRKLKLQQ